MRDDKACSVEDYAITFKFCTLVEPQMKIRRFPVLVNNFPFLLYYRGNYKTDLSFAIFEIVNDNLAESFDRNFVSRLSHLVVECIQNIYRYSESKETFEDYCLLYSDSAYCHIRTRNLVSDSKVDDLRLRLEELKKKTAEEIDEAYKEVLRSKTLTTKGAGLGLLEMARKSGNRINFELEKISEQEWSYTLHIKLPLPDKKNAVVPDEKNGDQIINDFLNEFSHNENTLLYSGDFSNVSLNHILNFITDQYKNEKNRSSSIFKYAMIELVQNIQRHAVKSADGTVKALLTVEWLKDKMVLSTSNFISDEKEAELVPLLKSLNKAVEFSLRTASEDKMNDLDIQGGLGLTDIARLNWPRLIDHIISADKNFGKSIDLSIKFDYER